MTRHAANGWGLACLLVKLVARAMIFGRTMIEPAGDNAWRELESIGDDQMLEIFDRITRPRVKKKTASTFIIFKNNK